MFDETPLSHRLRSETKEAHTTAERSGIMRAVLRGTVTHDEYAALLFNLHALYESLEQQLDANAAHDALAGVDWHVLRRTAALKADLTAWSSVAAIPSALEIATNAYVQRLEQVGVESPALLFSHAYLRYLGDLYGGQIMKGILTQAFPALAANGMSFYSFNDIGDPAAFKTEFRGAIDRLPAQDGLADAMVAEALRGYGLHADLFNALASESAEWRKS